MGHRVFFGHSGTTMITGRRCGVAVAVVVAAPAAAGEENGGTRRSHRLLRKYSKGGPEKIP